MGQVNIVEIVLPAIDVGVTPDDIQVLKLAFIGRIGHFEKYGRREK
jgi:hypothetical protein